MDFLYKLMFEKSGLENAAFLNGARTYLVLALGAVVAAAPQITELLANAGSMSSFEFWMAIAKIGGIISVALLGAGFKKAGEKNAVAKVQL